ncbi:HNH endonuclease signature motif containing protein [Pseudonocardia zijingensis]|uniref:HNH endonuclease signature motif containing protein n=1 Tax=Pseudonocardia zijingensis TaxID=153376 RepID=UPI0031E421B1
MALPPGAQLAAALEELAGAGVPNVRRVEVLQARSRQLAHEQALLFAELVEVAHTVALADADGEPDQVVARAAERFEWAAHEIAAALAWTPTAADRELELATALVERLPLVQHALRHGRIDRGKARVFTDYLDPATGDVTEAQARLLCERFVPLAPGLTTKQLADRLLRALQAIDPDLRRRRYERAVQARGVALYLDPRTGTATLTGNGLPPDEAAAAAARLDRLVETAKRAGHPGTRPQISADLYLGMLGGTFHGLNEQQIITRLLDLRRPEDHHTPKDHRDPESATEPETAPDKAAAAEVAAAGTAGTGAAPSGAAPSGAAAAPTAEPETAGSSAAEPWATQSKAAASTSGAAAATAASGSAAAAPVAASSGAAASDPAATAAPSVDGAEADRVAVREGIEIRLGLATAAGLDDRPGEIPGLGPIGAGVARAAVAAQHRGAAWRFAIVDTAGYLLLAGQLRRRPRITSRTSRAPAVRGGVVELHLTLAELQRYSSNPGPDPDSGLGAWAGVLAEIATAWADRHHLRRLLAADPDARFVRGPLAEHVRIRDRHCVGPGCTRPARRSDLDHTWEHGRGGRTVEVNIGPACKRHHPDKDRGWTLTQPEPGIFVWISPLGRTYRTRGEPIRPELPDPDTAPENTETTEAAEESAAQLDRRLRRAERRILEPPVGETPRPPPEPEQPRHEEPPPF